MISNIILSFVFRGNHFVLGWTFGVGLVIIVECVASIIVSRHNHNEFMKPLRAIEKDMKKAFEELDKLFYSKEEK